MACFVGTLFVAVPAEAHIRLDQPAPRTTISDLGGPCGDPSVPRSANPLVLEGGQELTLQWTETIDHDGHYRVAFSLEGDDIPDPAGLMDRCDPEVDAWCIVDGLADQAGSNSVYSYTFTVPNVDCDNCTLQVLQQTFTRYHQCVDVVIVAQKSESGGMGGAASTGGRVNEPGEGTGGVVDVPRENGEDAAGGAAASGGGSASSDSGCRFRGGPGGSGAWPLLAASALLPVLRRRSSRPPARAHG